MLRMAARGRLSPMGDSTGPACFENGWRAVRAVACGIAVLLAPTAAFAGNVVEYSYDAAGNIVQVKRQSVGALSVTGFTPTSGAVGAAVTILGSGFSATPANNTVRFNGVVAAVGAADTGSLAVTVPAGATTGRISVTVGASTATSAQDFTVVIPGAPTIVSFTPASGAAGTSVSVTGLDFDVAPGATTVKLNGVVATASIPSATDLSFTVPGATATGRITATTALGTGASATDFVVPPPGINAADIVTTLRLPADGTSSNFVVSTASKYGLILFDGTAGTYYTLQFSQFATSPTSAVISYQVIKPDNTVLASGNVGNTSRPTIHVPKLPATGTYSVVVGVASATLNTYVRVAADPILSIDGPAIASSMDFGGQSARFVFDASASQRISAGVMGLTLTPAWSSAVGFNVYLPDGSALYTPNAPYCYPAGGLNPQGNCDGEFTTTVAGTYTLIAASPGTTYASFSAQLSNEVAGSFATVDSPVAVTLGRVGQDARFAFSATAGDSLAIDVSGAVLQPQAQTLNAAVYKPDGSWLASCSGVPPAGAYCELGAVASTGTYSAWIDPNFGAYGDMTLTLKQGPTLTPADPPTAFATGAIGESARFRFTASAGRNFAVSVTNLAYVGTSTTASSLKVFGPDRTQIGSTVSCSPTAAGGTCKLSVLSLTQAGTYSVVLVPPGGVKITGNVNLSADITGTLTAGSPVSLNATRAGQNARFTFSGTAGDSTSVKLFAIATTPAAQSVWVTVYKPDGSYLNQNYGSSAASTIVNLGSLPATGTYSVLVAPAYGATWQAQLMLDPGVAITIGGPFAPLATTTASEPLRLRFDGVAGQRVELGLTGLAYATASSSSTSLTAYSRDGTSYGSVSCSTAGTGSCEWGAMNITSTGTYSIVLMPPTTSSIAAGSFAVSTAVSGSFVVGDPAQTVSIDRPGQTARYTFPGTAAQLLRLNWSGTTVSGGASVGVLVLKPDGNILSTGSFGNGATGGFDIASLPVAGTYTIVFDPINAATMTAPTSLVTR